MEKHNRRKFLFAGLSLAALVATFRYTRKTNEKKTLKFLTQEGKLVELDANQLPASKQPASKQDLQNWVKKKLPL